MLPHYLVRSGSLLRRGGVVVGASVPNQFSGHSYISHRTDGTMFKTYCIRKSSINVGVFSAEDSGLFAQAMPKPGRCLRKGVSYP